MKSPNLRRKTSKIPHAPGSLAAAWMRPYFLLQFSSVVCISKGSAMSPEEEKILNEQVAKVFAPFQECLGHLQTLVNKLTELAASLSSIQTKVDRLSERMTKQENVLHPWTPIGPSQIMLTELDKHSIPRPCNCQYLHDNKCGYTPLRPTASIGDDNTSAKKPIICPVILGGNCPYNFLTSPVDTPTAPTPQLDGAPIKTTHVVC